VTTAVEEDDLLLTRLLAFHGLIMDGLQRMCGLRGYYGALGPGESVGRFEYFVLVVCFGFCVSLIQ